MKYSKPKKQWKKPEVKVVRVGCECTAYVEAM
jgi:coenzyme PQQ precursor peptide PqqA